MIEPKVFTFTHRYHRPGRGWCRMAMQSCTKRTDRTLSQNGHELDAIRERAEWLELVCQVLVLALSQHLYQCQSKLPVGSLS